jgi:hypothetical protein
MKVVRIPLLSDLLWQVPYVQNLISWIVKYGAMGPVIVLEMYNRTQIVLYPHWLLRIKPESMSYVGGAAPLHSTR